MSRRLQGIGGPLLGAAVAGIVLAGIAGAANGDPVIIGQANSGSSTTKLTANPQGPAFQVVSSGHLAVRGESANARGVLGIHTSSTGTDPGVEGGSNSTSADAIGVYGHAFPGIGVVGAGGVGVRGGGLTGVAGYGIFQGVGVAGYGHPGGFFHGTPAAKFDGDAVITGAHYLQLQAMTGAPPATDCDAAAEAGRMVVRKDATPHLYVCLGSGGWYGIT
jgi:hypothetical protein